MPVYLSSTAAMWYLPFVLPIALWVAWSDLKYMKIYNNAVLAMLGIYLVLGFFTLPLDQYLWHMTHFVVVLVIGFILNYLNMVGAGDAKIAAAMAPFIMREDAVMVAYLLAALILLTYFTHRLARILSFVRNLAPEWESWDRKDFPMGVTISATFITYLVLGIFYGQ